jgi:hypothetical protein
MFGECGRMRIVYRSVPTSPTWSRIAQANMIGNLKRASKLEEKQAIAAGRQCDADRLYHLTWTHKVNNGKFSDFRNLIKNSDFS